MTLSGYGCCNLLAIIANPKCRNIYLNEIGLIKLEFDDLRNYLHIDICRPISANNLYTCVVSIILVIFAGFVHLV